MPICEKHPNAKWFDDIGCGPCWFRKAEKREDREAQFKPKTCKACHKEFIPRSRANSLCSEECKVVQRKRVAKKNWKDFKERIRVEVSVPCKNCGTKFTKLSTNEKKVFCSQQCRERFPYPPAKPVPDCQWCGTSLEGRNPRTRFCSKDCYHDHRNHEVNISRSKANSERIYRPAMPVEVQANA